MVIEIMGTSHWLTLYSGIAGGADVILIPEIPYEIERVAKVVETRAKADKSFSILAVAEGAMDKEEAKMKKKERSSSAAASPPIHQPADCRPASGAGGRGSARCDPRTHSAWRKPQRL